MESNKEEALRALEIARRKRAEGDISGALKFAKKSQSLYASPQAETFLSTLSEAETSNGSAFASGTSTVSGASEQTPQSRKPKETEHRQGRQNKEFTSEQIAVVERVRKCQHHEYYEILELTKEATDSEVKKSYRRLALQLHPDKNGAPNADEAFKMVSRAFQVLSDPDKRAIFDRHGTDPDSRTAGMGESPFGNGFGGMRTSYGGGGMYGDEISPDELFNMFFGGGGFGGGGFNAGPFGQGFGGGFGGPGIRVHRFGGARPRRQEAPQQQPQGNSSVLYQLLPVLLLLAFTIIPALFNSSSPPPPAPSFIFENAKPPYTLQRSTPQHGIPYFVNPSEVESLSISKLRQLDQKAEVTFVRGLRDQCQLEHDAKQQNLANAQGWFGQIKDQDAWEEAKRMRLQNCERLRAMGYRPEIY